MHLFIIIDNFIYEVSKYSDHHPGEGICSVYLRNFNGCHVDTMFDKFHGDEPFKHLIMSREKGFHDGVIAVGYNLFSNEKKKDQRKLIKSLSLIDSTTKIYEIPNDHYSMSIHRNGDDGDHLYFNIKRNRKIETINLKYIGTSYITTNQEYIATFSKIEEFVSLMCKDLDLYIF